MIISEYISVKIAPSNILYWKEKGYETGRTGGRAGANGNPRIKVKVADLKDGSGVYVECRCDICSREYRQRFERDTIVCSRCRRIRSGLGNKHGKKHDEHIIPSRKELQKFADLGRGGKTAAAKHFHTTPIIIVRWFKERGIEFDGNRVAVPPGFVEYYLREKPSKKKIGQKYGIAIPLANRWIKDLGLSFRGVTTKIPAPLIEEMVRLNQTMDTAELALHYGVNCEMIVKWFRKSGRHLKRHRSGTSKQEQDLRDFLNTVKPGFIHGAKRVLENQKLELDMYHPDLKVAFEYDGIFWHSRRSDHRFKWDECQKKGIMLYRIHSNEWLYQRDLVCSMVRARLGMLQNKIYAKTCDVRILGRNLAMEHHATNHIAGYGNSSVNLGLYKNDELLSVMSFAKSRYPGGHEWELVRFSSKMNHSIVGGAGKLFVSFVKSYKPKSVLTFADLRWGLGNVYETLGFSRIKRGDPTYWYYHYDLPQRFSRIAFTKAQLPKKLVRFDPDLTEVQNMENNKYYQYWDCGSDHFVWTG